MEVAIGTATGLIGSMINQLSHEVVQAYVASSELGLNSTKIKRDLLFTHGLLSEAQRRGVSDNPGLQGLVHELKAKADKAEDALDELHYFIIQDQLDGTQYAKPDLGDGLHAHAHHGRQAVRHTFGNWLTCFSRSRTQDDDVVVVTHSVCNATTSGSGTDGPAHKLPFDRVAMSKKIKSAIEEIHSLCEPVSQLLRVTPHNSDTAIVTTTRPQIGSTIARQTLYGRRDIFEQTLEDITSGTYHRETYSVLPIVGPGGIGKTTFTQHLYNDKRIEEHFSYRVWVCVSTDFDVHRLTKQIHDRIRVIDKEESNTTNQANNIEQFQIYIAEKLKSKRFFIVFDDIWECNREGWERMLAPFRNGEAKGNMVVVTTRFPSKAEIVKTANPIYMKGLEPDEFFIFFEEFIFGGNKPEDYEDDLSDVARSIAKKLKGSPLAAKTVGELLKRNLSREHWLRVLENNEWQKQKGVDDIMPSLKISYDYLPLHLKKCFPYFSLFPEDYIFCNVEITNFWSAIGIIDNDDNYMEQLVDYGFLMKEGDNMNQNFVMHDLLHELSRIISSEECLNICSSNFRADSIPQTIRQVSITLQNKYQETFRGEMIKLRSKIDIANLRSLMIFSEYDETIDGILKDTFMEIECLRVLFIEVKSPDYFPHNFSRLIHLRCLRITAANRISEKMTLPCTLSRFYHLKFLDLRGNSFYELPKDITRLINLRHCFATCELFSNVPEVGKMNFIHELKSFHVKKESIGFELSQLGKLTQLGGELSIYHLGNVATKEEAMEAKLVCKRDLKKLRLEWGTYHKDTAESDVLDGLEPHPNLEELNITGHGTTTCPSWLTSDISMKLLKSLYLDGVSCVTPPPFGQLVHLTSLTLNDISGFHQIRPGFGIGAKDKSFMHLKEIVLSHLPELIEWIGEPNSFSRLEYIAVVYCPNLCRLPFMEPSFTCNRLLSLEIGDCPKLSMPAMPHVPTEFFRVESLLGNLRYYGKSLSIERYEGELVFDNMGELEELRIVGELHFSLEELNKLKSLRSVDFLYCSSTCQGLQVLTSLQSVKVHGGEGNFFRTIKPFHPSLRELYITQETSMHSMALISNLTSLTTLTLVDCDHLTVKGFNPNITVNLNQLTVYNMHPCRYSSVAAGLFSELMVMAAIRTKLLLSAATDSFFFHQLKELHVDCISAVLVAPICSLLAASLHTIQFHNDQKVERLTEDEEDALHRLTSLRYLAFLYCPDLLSLPRGLQRLSSLRGLDVQDCPKIRSMPKDGIPASLREILVHGCNPELIEQAHKLKAKNPGLIVLDD